MRVIHRDIVSALIFSEDGKLLMGRKDPASGGVYADYWHIPGGGIETGEGMMHALRREVLEETGIDIDGLPVRLVDDQGRGESVKTLTDSGEKALCMMKFIVYRVDMDRDSAETVLWPRDDLVRLEWVALSDIGDYKLTPPSVELFARLGYVHHG